jgi:hypothetical protein
MWRALGRIVALLGLAILICVLYLDAQANRRAQEARTHVKFLVDIESRLGNGDPTAIDDLVARIRSIEHKERLYSIARESISFPAELRNEQLVDWLVQHRSELKWDANCAVFRNTP